MSKCAILNPSDIITSKAIVSSEWAVGKVRLKKLHDVVTIQMAEIYNITCISFILKKLWRPRLDQGHKNLIIFKVLTMMYLCQFGQ